MFTASMDLGSLLDADTRFQRAFDQAGRDMKETLDRAASEARSTHEYQDRTGNLTASTYASELQSTADSHEVELGARTDYAEYVNARGLMSIEEAASSAEVELSYLFEGLAASI